MRQFQGVDYRISFLTSRLVRLEYSKKGIFEDRATQVVRNRQFDCDFSTTVVEDDKWLSVETEYLNVSFNKGPFHRDSLSIQVKQHRASPLWRYGDPVNTLKGTARTLDGADGEIELEEGIISRDGYALLEDSSSFIFEVGQEPQEREKNVVDLYFFGYGLAFQEAIYDYFLLTGFPPLLPRFALGNWWSRFWPYSDKEYRSLMDRFASEKVPLAVSVIDMDWHRTWDVPERFGSGWTGYSWNRELFPHPETFLASLHQKNLKVTLNVHPADGIRAFEDSYERVAKRLSLDTKKEEPARFDLMNPDFRRSYFEDVHHPLEEEGVDFWWIDWQQGEEGVIDPLWLLNTYHFDDMKLRKGYGLILSRYAGPGSHRYPIGFSGDTIISWDSLDFQPYFTNTASNIGYTWWSHDIGGHMQGTYDEELSLRWLQYGVFSPINRLHSSYSVFSSKEPWSYSKEVDGDMKNWLRFRHQLIPYLYSMNVKTHLEGISLIQPLYYEYPEEDESYAFKNQYLFGSEMMVVPITQKSDSIYKVSRVEAWFPQGRWYDFFTDFVYQGPQVLPLYREKNQVAVFAREGAIIPLDGAPALRGVELPSQVDWHLFPGHRSTFTLLEEKEGQQLETTLSVDWDKKEIKLEFLNEELLTDRIHKLIFHSGDAGVLILENKSQTCPFQYERENKEPLIREWMTHRLHIAEIPFSVKEKVHEKLLDPETLQQGLLGFDQALQGQIEEYLFLLDKNRR